MKRSQIISIAIVLIAIVLSVLLHRPRMLPLKECSDIYREYYKTEGIQATFVKDYDLGDSVTVDVTILQAIDSLAWHSLLCDFHVVTDSAFRPSRDEAEVMFTSTGLFPKGCKGQPPASVLTGNDMFIVHYPRNTVYIFHLCDERQFNTIIRYKYKKLSKQ